MGAEWFVYKVSVLDFFFGFGLFRFGIGLCVVCRGTEYSNFLLPVFLL